MSPGLGHSAAEELFAGMNVPFMSRMTFDKHQRSLEKAVHEVTEESMTAAAKEEMAHAVATGQVTAEGYGLVTVVADGMWSKRSYRTNYNANSGMVGSIY